MGKSFVSAVAILVAISTAAVVAKPAEGRDVYDFESYVSKYRKSYSSSEEHDARRTIFERNAAAVAAHNKLAESGVVTWYSAINSFSDRTDLELASLRGYDRALGYHRLNQQAENCKGIENCARWAKKDGDEYVPVSNVLKMGRERSANTSLDWRTEKVLTAVKDQGGCGSCWTFGAVEALESAYAIQSGRVTALSEQQVLDCTPNTEDCGGTGGCGGGIPEIAYDKIQELGGLASEWIYPYISYPGENYNCSFEKSMLSAPSSFMGSMSYMKMPSNKYDPLMAGLRKGPMAVSVDASTWSSYDGGVFDGCNQDSPSVDHVVLLVGYGSDPKLGDYWIIRNSWGAEWGEDGFMRLRRTSSEETRCGIDTDPQAGIACKGDPPTQKVCGTCGILLDPVLPMVEG